MSIKHLSDNEIQQYLDDNKSDELITEHVSVCDSCRLLLHQYQLLYGSIESEKIALSDDFSTKTMGLIHNLDVQVSYSYRNFVLIGLAGIVISLLSMVYIIGYEVILQYIKEIRFAEMFTYKETTDSIINRYGSIIKIAISGGIILLFFTQLDRLLSKIKTQKFSVFSF